MLLTELVGLEEGVYRMEAALYIPFTKIKLFSYTQGYISKIGVNLYMTTTGKDTHTRLQEFPCVGFALNDDGSRTNYLSKNFCGWMTNIVDKEDQEKYFAEFMNFYNNTTKLVKV